MGGRLPVFLCFILLWIGYYAEMEGGEHNQKPRQTGDRNGTNDLVNAIVRLVGGAANYMGNIELVIGGHNYRVCDDYWNNSGASVVCRMLGYSLGGTATNQSMFGAGDSEIILDNVRCNGTEASLAECDHLFGVDNDNCFTDEYAGVICAEETPTYCGQRPYDETDPSFQRRRGLDSDNQKREPEKPSTIPREWRNEQERYDDARPSLLPKIVGGNGVSHGQYPWQVNLRRVQGTRADGTDIVLLFCGGTIISEYWVLTAAHCFDGIPEAERTNVTVVVGDFNRREMDIGEQHFMVGLVVTHQHYRGGNRDYDIALIGLNANPKSGRGILFSSYVQPVCLPTRSTRYTPGTVCTVSGWGRLHYGDADLPDVLQAVSVPLLSRRTCRNVYGRILSWRLSRRVMCAGRTSHRVNPCYGDSGGPLVCKVNGIYTLFGIVSWGQIGCVSDNTRPAVYTNVKKYLTWVTTELANGRPTRPHVMPSRPPSTN